MSFMILFEFRFNFFLIHTLNLKYKNLVIYVDNLNNYICFWNNRIEIIQNRFLVLIIVNLITYYIFVL